VRARSNSFEKRAMGRAQRQQRSRRRGRRVPSAGGGGNAGGNAVGATNGVNSGCAASSASKMLALVQQQWPRLLVSRSLRSVHAGEAGFLNLKKELASSVPCEANFERLETSLDVSRFQAAAVSDRASLHLLERIFAAFREKNLEIQDGMFLAVKAPGRDETNVAVYVQSWLELGSAFRKTDEKVAQKQLAMMRALRVYDTTERKRGVVRFTREVLQSVEYLLGHLDEIEQNMGRVAISEVRPMGENDSVENASNPNNKAYDVTPSILISGSVANFVCLILVQQILMFHKKPPTFTLEAEQKVYLLDSLKSTQDGEFDSLLGEINSAADPLMQLFSCELLSWQSSVDKRLLKCAVRLEELHAQNIASEILANTADDETSHQQKKPQSSKIHISEIAKEEDEEEEEADDTDIEDGGNDDDDDEAISVSSVSTSETSETKRRGSGPLMSTTTTSDSISHDFSSGEWTSVSSRRRARRLSQRRNRSMEASLSPVRDSKYPSHRKTSHLPPLGTSAKVSTNGTRIRGESSETISISSQNSSATLFEDDISSSTPPPSVVGSKLVNAVKAEPFRPRINSICSEESEARMAPEEEKPIIIEGVKNEILNQLSIDIEEMSSGLERVSERRKPWMLAVAERIKEVVQQLFPQATTSVFGSMATGLSAPCSDIDMVIHNYVIPERSAMRTLGNHLKSQPWVQIIHQVEHSRMPVIRLATAQIPISFRNHGSLINVDITFATHAHGGLRTCALVKSFIERFPPLKPLALVLKQFLVEKGLNDPFVGGLTTYGLVIMIVSVLQRYYPNGISNRRLHSNALGAFLVAFLQEYSTSAFIERGVWIYTSEFRSEVELAQTREACQQIVREAQAQDMAPLVILDPLDLRTPNNIGRTCFGINQLILAFSEALQVVLSTGVPCKEDVSILGRVFSANHHRHVVELVAQVWCPRENPMSTDIKQWATGAKGILEHILETQPMCVTCNQPQQQHSPKCALKSLLQTFPGTGKE